MDQDVIAAMARWPNVPAVCGWLSLDARGRWRLHPDGDAHLGGAGTSITNPGILAFMNRNYAQSEDGSWYFQNGPQRVFVRLDCAPLLLRLASEADSGLVTHTGVSVTRIDAWRADERGNLYALTEHGPGMIEDRDLPALLAQMRLPDGAALLDQAPAWLTGEAPANGQETALDVELAPYGCAELAPMRSDDRERALGFLANPVSSRNA